jgi:hypothetical protein
MKIPFERTIAGAYRFAFTNFLSILGIGWFPYLLLSAIVGGLVYYYAPSFIALFHTVQVPKPDPADAMRFVGAILGAEALIVPLFLVISSMVTVGVMRKALGLHPGPVFFFFSLGSQVWRLIGSYLLLLLLLWGGAIVAGILIGVVYYLLDKAAPSAAAPVTVLLGIAAFFYWIYAFVRVYFFVPAIVVAENHIGISRSWRLGKGNFWRIVGILLIMSIPIGIAAQMIEGPVLQFGLGGTQTVLGPNPTPEDMQNFFSLLLGALKKVGPVLLVIQLVHWTLLSGLMGGAIANAYNLVTGGSDIAPAPAKATA